MNLPFISQYFFKIAKTISAVRKKTYENDLYFSGNKRQDSEKEPKMDSFKRYNIIALSYALKKLGKKDESNNRCHNLLFRH